MSIIAIAGDRVVVTSTVSLDNLRLVAKHRPDALCLKDEEGNETFRVGVGSNNISPKGVSYANATYNEGGLATVSALIPEGTEDAKDYVVDTYGLAIANLNKVEAALPDIVREIKKTRDELRSSIVTNTPRTQTYD